MNIPPFISGGNPSVRRHTRRAGTAPRAERGRRAAPTRTTDGRVREPDSAVAREVTSDQMRAEDIFRLGAIGSTRPPSGGRGDVTSFPARVTAEDDKPANLPRRAISPVEKETIGLEMVFRSVRGTEPVLQQIVPDEESVHSQKIAPYQAVALPPAQHLQSLQAGTIVRRRDDPFPGVRG